MTLKAHSCLATAAVELSKESGVGPVSNRTKADGTLHEALRWVNTQDADWAATAEFDLLHDQAKNAKTGAASSCSRSWSTHKLTSLKSSCCCLPKQRQESMTLHHAEKACRNTRS